MPELPEVQTTVDGLNKKVKGKIIKDVWTDIALEKTVLPHHATTTKSKLFFEQFKKTVTGAKIVQAKRRAKNILLHLSNGYTILIHMKMTGHMMYGSYVFDRKAAQWKPSPSERNDALRDPFNKFLHTVFTLSDGKHLVLSDMRKFAKVTVLATDKLYDSPHLDSLGPEPLEHSFTLKQFIERLTAKKQRPIKEVLLNQSVISGIGNIYSDEMLWYAGIHPLRRVHTLKQAELQKLYRALKMVLRKGIDFGGDSTSDYRDISGNKGSFQSLHHAYRLTGKPCKKRGCSGIIARIPFSGRGAHFCPVHQK